MARALLRTASRLISIPAVCPSMMLFFLDAIDRSDSQEELIPLVVLAGGIGTTSRKRAVEQAVVSDPIQFQPSPVWEWASAKTTDLICQEFDRTFVNPVVVRLDDSRLFIVDKLD